MRLSIRFILPLLLVLGGIAYLMVPVIDELTMRWFVRDLGLRSKLIASAVHIPMQDLVRTNDQKGMQRLFTAVTQDERLYAVGFRRTEGAPVVGTDTLTPAVLGLLDAATPGMAQEDAFHRMLNGDQGPLVVSIEPLAAPAAPGGQLILVHDAGFIARRSAETRKYLFISFVFLGLVISILTVAIAHLSWRGWTRGIQSLLSPAFLRGDGLLYGTTAPAPELRPIARDLRALVRELESGRNGRDEEQTTWTPEALRAILHGDLRGEEIIVVSNREPYIHDFQDGAVVVRRPASGLVTALEPVLRACSGTWIAHGGGSADRTTVDGRDHVAVPPEEPAYQLRRIWLDAAEEQGYYYGFSNEGLWPLCHAAHVRPVFRSEDWEKYVAVNQKFARAVAEESKSPNPIVLVQDYHLALLPKMIRDLLPDATIITFWHIPWPNPEAFGICPWREQLLDGLLGSSIVGFHTQFHCNNFMDTVDRHLEARVDRELFTVSRHGETSAVKRYPISIEWPPPPALREKTIPHCREDVRRRHGLPPGHALGVGVDRFDYTKGIEERLRAVERLFETRPEWVGRFTFVQIAAPTRSQIGPYRDYETRVRAEAERINRRFSAGGHPAIILKVEHHEPEAVHEYYRAADLCFVSSLHDGMNLVAKEFVASRDDETGVLLLSQFAGASRELPEALIVNPYDTDQCAAALGVALDMPVDEQRLRMRLMRNLVGEFNVYRWAGRMLADAATMRRRHHIASAGGHRPEPLP